MQKHADVSAIGIDIGKNTFHLIGQDRRGKIVMRARVSRAQLMERLVNVPRCLIGMEPVLAPITFNGGFMRCRVREQIIGHLRKVMDAVHTASIADNRRGLRAGVADAIELVVFEQKQSLIQPVSD